MHIYTIHDPDPGSTVSLSIGNAYRRRVFFSFLFRILPVGHVAGLIPLLFFRGFFSFIS